MTSTEYILKSLWHYCRMNAGVLAGVALAAAIMTGALGVGDSVRSSLHRLAMGRIGRIHYAMETGNRPVQSSLAGRLEKQINARVTPALLLGGTVSLPSGKGRINQLNVIGVDQSFWSLADDVPDTTPQGPAVMLNAKSAQRLQVKAGDSLVMRVRKLRRVPAENPFSRESASMVSARVKVGGIVSDRELGRFSLYPDQVAPYNLYVDLHYLNRLLGQQGKANLVLTGEVADRKTEAQDRLASALNEAWRLDDVGLRLDRTGTGKELYLQSESVFIRQAVLQAAHEVSGDAEDVFSYFVNSIEAGGRTTPYSFAAAPGDRMLPEGMSDSEVVINRWLAEDLGVGTNDRVRISYYTLGGGGALSTTGRLLTVCAIVPTEGRLAASVPDPGFPGLSGVESCADWQPGAPVSLDRIRKKDERYWSEYRTAPKLYVTTDAAVDMWANRFGSMTAVRFPGRISKAEIAAGLRQELRASDLGMLFRPVRQEAIAAGRQSVDFGGLFAGLSFFLIVAALMLTGLLFIFNIGRRSEEMGLLLAMGFTPARVSALVLAEYSVVAVLGIAAGSAVGVLYTRLMIMGLSTIWRDAVRTSELHVDVAALSVIAGAAAMGVTAVAVMWVALRRTTGRHEVLLLKKGGGGSVGGQKNVRLWWRAAVSFTCAAGVVVSLLSTPAGSAQATVSFFTAGSLALIAAWFLCDIGLLAVAAGKVFSRTTVLSAALRNASSRRWRSLLVIAIFSCGVFLLATVTANRKRTGTGPDGRETGTGGFALVGESAIPLEARINTARGQRALGLDPERLSEADFVSFRLREGGNASCLNLHRVSTPRLLGADPGELERRGSFEFAATAPGFDPASGWELLSHETGSGRIAGIADHTVIVWSLGKTPGDYIDYYDASGKKFEVELVAGLANSIFQGNILVHEEDLLRKYPAISGYRFFLVNVPRKKVEGTRLYLNERLADWGADFVKSGARLAEFNSVQNTYLDIFLLLGGLGLVLGSGGLGIVVLRNVMERRGELALLRAIGFSRPMVRRMLLYEHCVLLALGLVCGAGAAVFAVVPALRMPGVSLPYASLSILLAAVSVSGFLWVLISTVVATKSELLPALRSE